MRLQKSTRTFLVMMLTALAFIPIVFGSASYGVAAEDEIVIKYGSYAPPRITCDIPLMWWCDEVVKRSAAKGVKIKFEYYWSGALAKPVDHLHALGAGIYDVGWLTPALAPKELPYLAITADTYMNEADLRVLGGAINELCLSAAKAELDKANLQYLCPYGVGDYNLLSIMPFKSFKQADGFRCRTYGSQGLAWKELGGVPISMPMPEVYGALQRGILDGILYMPTTIVAAKYYEIAKHYTKMPFGPGACATVMNKDTWDKLPLSVKNIIVELREEMPNKLYELSQEAESKALELMQKNGVILYELPEEEQASFPELKQKLWSQIATKFEKKGLPAKEGLKLWSKLVEEQKEKIGKGHKKSEK